MINKEFKQFKEFIKELNDKKVPISKIEILKFKSGVQLLTKDQAEEVAPLILAWRNGGIK